LNSGSNRLPWTRVILFGTSASGQRAVIIGLGSVCSKAANGCFGRGIGDAIFAVRHVNKKLDAGGVGRRASSIARPIRARSGGAPSRSAIGSGSARGGKKRQLTWIRRARASAYSVAAKIFRANPAIGRVATNYSPFPMNTRASVFAAWNADWLCVAFSIAKHAIRRGVGVRVASV
jgi:hypothetical protein